MALFLRGDVWWMEYRTRRVRRVLSTGFRKADKAKAQAAYDALRLGMGAKPRRSAMEKVLEAIYGNAPAEPCLALSSMWSVYQDWCRGKGKVVAKLTETNRRGVVERFVAWAGKRGLSDAADVTVAVARDFIVELRSGNLANKTLRTYVQYLGGVWKAVGQMVGRLDNPWLAACPDPDGSGEVREAFSPEQESAVLSAAKAAGHGWWLASVVSRWTGLRYGDVARLDWKDVDLERRVIEVNPSKTRRHGVSVTLPIADPLHAALSSAVPQGKREGFVLPEMGLRYPLPPVVPFSEVLAAAGVSGPYTFHSWRHTFRTRLADAGVSDEAARRLGGWTNLGMAAHYDHSKHLPELRAAISAMQGRSVGSSGGSATGAAAQGEA